MTVPVAGYDNRGGILLYASTIPGILENKKSYDKCGTTNRGNLIYQVSLDRVSLSLLDFMFLLEANLSFFCVSTI